MRYSFHVLLRYAQRVLKIENEEKAVKYVKSNLEEVCFGMMNFTNESELLIKNFSLGGGGETYSYYLNKDILIVVTVNSGLVVTLYDIKIDLDEETNLKIINEYKSTIRRNVDSVIKLESKKSNNDINSRRLESIIEYQENELKRLKLELESSICKSREIISESKILKSNNKDLMSDIMYGYKKLGI